MINITTKETLDRKIRRIKFLRRTLVSKFAYGSLHTKLYKHQLERIFKIQDYLYLKKKKIKGL